MGISGSAVSNSGVVVEGCTQEQGGSGAGMGIRD